MGPRIRSDVIDVYVLRRRERCQVEFLQLHRAKGVLSGTWQPVMGHSREGESAAQTALRELREETGIAPDAAGPLKLLNLWQLEEPNIYFLASLDTIVMGPCFAAEVAGDAEPVLNDEHDGRRWIERAHADRHFLWPGQRKALRQIMDDVLSADAPSSSLLKVALPDGPTRPAALPQTGLVRIVGHGVDIIEIDRIARMMQEHGRRFLDRVFTAEEQAYAAAHTLQAERLAGRFAAKEAILKALGTGWRDGIAWTDAEIVRLPSGQPTVSLHQECRRIADSLGIAQWSLSISHNKVHAVASAIAMGV